MTPQDEPETIEAQLRATAPLLPPELRQQVLRRCQNERRNVPLRAWFRPWRLAGAFASFVLVCGIANSRLDAQNQALLTGDNGRQTERALALPADSAGFVLALRWRISQLALLLHDKHSG